MITLLAASTFQGQAGAATSVTASIFGDELAAGADSFKKLYQGQLPSSVTVLYTVPGSTQALIKTITLANTTGGAVTVTLFVDGAVAANRIVNLSVPALGFASYDADGWKVYDATGQQLFVGATGPTGSTGAQGDKGWSPVLAVVTDGARRVFQIVNWVGGAGTMPSIVNQFIGSAGIVATAALAEDVRGPAGAAGTSPNAFTTITGNTGTATADSASDSLSIVGSNGVSTAASDNPEVVTITGANAFGVVTGTTGTATADASGDTLAITGANGVTTAATDTPDGLVITGPNIFATVTGNSGTSTPDSGTDSLGIVGSGSVSTVATDGPELVTISNAAATTTAAGNMSAIDKIRMGQEIDAQADLGFVGDLGYTNATSSASTGTPTTITDSANSFAPFAGSPNYYVGKRITLNGAGAAGAMYVGTITAVAPGGGSVTVTPGISTTVASKIAQFGTDNTAAIAALNTLVNTTNAAFPSVKLNFGMSLTNSYGFPTPVLLNQTIQVEGIGGGHTADTGNYSRIGGTRLAWWGTSCDGGVAFGAFWTVSPTGVQSIKRPAFRSLWLDCRNGDQNEALIALKLASCQGWSLDDFFVMDPMAIGIWFDVATSPTEARDCTRGLATNIALRCLDNTSGPTAVTLTPTTTSSAVNIATAQSLTLAAANGLRSGSDYIWVNTIIGKPTLARYTGGGGTTTLTGVICAAEDAFNNPTTVTGCNVVQASPSNSCAMYLNGGTGANTCCNTFLQVAISHGAAGAWGPAAIEFGNSDSNDFQSPYINGGTRAIFGAAPNNRQTKPGVRMNGSNTNAALASRNNTFKGGDPGSLPITNGGAEFMGSLNTGAMMGFPSGPSYWEAYQMGNGAPVPVADTGASLYWSGNGMFREGGLNALAANHVLTAAVANVVNGCWAVVPPQGWQIGTTFKWEAYLGKTAVGTAWTLNIRQHSALTAGAGTVIASLVFVATGAIDTGYIEVDLVCVGPLGGTCAALARYQFNHQLPATGLSTGVVTPVQAPVSTDLEDFTGAMTMATFNSAAPGSGPTFLFLEIVPTTAATVMTVLAPAGMSCVKAGNP